ncbi:MAG: HipA domain-containing protein, partial [Gammaproteobacteria bacterium]|nr:HipA domain-containing protein [Gammaproteobacteria bacterium]
KFRSFIDPKDIGPIEYAYHLMALDAKLEVPQAKLFPSKVCPGYFGVKRFDRVKGKRLHMHTISGLLHADHRFPSLDYEAIMKATLWLSKDSRACEKQFRAAVFNVLSHNRDDHAKNFSFLMDEKGTWQVSPAYDLTFSSGPSGEHCSTIMGEGKHPSITHLLKLAAVTSLKKQTALQIIEEVKAATSKWKLFATEAGVHANSLKMIQSALHRIERENRGSL